MSFRCACAQHNRPCWTGCFPCATSSFCNACTQLTACADIALHSSEMCACIAEEVRDGQAQLGVWSKDRPKLVQQGQLLEGHSNGISDLLDRLSAP